MRLVLISLPACLGEDRGCLGTCAAKELCLDVRKSAPLAQVFTKLHYLRRCFRLAFVCESQEGNAKVTSRFATQRNQLYSGTERDGTNRRQQLTLDFISDDNDSLECVGHAYDTQRKAQRCAPLARPLELFVSLFIEVDQPGAFYTERVQNFV